MSVNVLAFKVTIPSLHGYLPRASLEERRGEEVGLKVSHAKTRHIDGVID